VDIGNQKLNPMKNLICPISTKRIDSNVSRFTVFLNVVLMVVFLITENPIFILIVSIDYFIRATLNAKYSPLKQLAAFLVRPMGLKKKQIDLAPKVFASRLGFLCAFSSLVLIYAGFTTASLIIAALLMVLSIMDSVFNFCVGCLIYHHLVFPIFK
jgi:hypothetical protein